MERAETISFPLSNREGRSNFPSLKRKESNNFHPPEGEGKQKFPSPSGDCVISPFMVRQAHHERATGY